MKKKKQDIAVVKDFSLEYREKKRILQVYEDFSLSIAPGEKVALLGESGSGKSTLGKFLAGILPKNARILSGRYVLDGEDRFFKGRYLGMNKIRGSKISFIFQDAQESMNPAKTIGAHFEELLSFHYGTSKEEVREKALKKMEELTLPNPERIYACYPFELSGGMCQRVAIAMALCTNPSLMIADEPTSALDTVSANKVIEELKMVEETACLVITHDISVAKELADRIVVVDKGRKIEEGPTEVLLTYPREEVTKKFLTSYREISNLLPGKEPNFQTPVLEVEGLEKFYGQRKVLKNISFQVYQGEIYGIIGQSGCGKSTLARSVLGLETKVRGKVMWEGKDLLNVTGERRRKLSGELQMIFQNSRSVLNPRRTVEQLVEEPLQYMEIGDREYRKKTVREVLRAVELEENLYYAKPPGLSTGQCQRVTIARALALKPKILICDEVLSALDVTTQYQILKLLLKLKDTYHFTILMITHDLRIAKNLCHHIMVMDKGEIVEILRGGEDFRKTKHPATKALMDAMHLL